MQPRRRRTGTGVTEREELDISWFNEGSSEERQDRAALAFSMRPRWDWYEELRANSCSILQDYSLPSSFGRYLKDQHGNWVADEQFEATHLAITKFTLDPERNELPNVSMDDGYEFLTDIAESQWGCDSIAHFAARSLQMISVLEMCRKTNERPGAEFAAHQLRDIISAMQFKQQWEDDALTGRGVRTNLAENRTRNALRRAARVREMGRAGPANCCRNLEDTSAAFNLMRCRECAAAFEYQPRAHCPGPTFNCQRYQRSRPTESWKRSLGRVIA
jgi:hypothetical protein